MSTFKKRVKPVALTVAVSLLFSGSAAHAIEAGRQTVDLKQDMRALQEKVASTKAIMSHLKFDLKKDLDAKQSMDAVLSHLVDLERKVSELRNDDSKAKQVEIMKSAIAKMQEHLIRAEDPAEVAIKDASAAHALVLQDLKKDIQSFGDELKTTAKALRSASVEERKDAIAKAEGKFFALVKLYVQKWLAILNQWLHQDHVVKANEEVKGESEEVTAAESEKIQTDPVLKPVPAELSLEVEVRELARSLDSISVEGAKELFRRIFAQRDLSDVQAFRATLNDGTILALVEGNAKTLGSAAGAKESEYRIFALVDGKWAEKAMPRSGNALFVNEKEVRFFTFTGARNPSFEGSLLSNVETLFWRQCCV